MPFNPEQMLIAVAAAGTAIAIVALIVTLWTSKRRPAEAVATAPARTTPSSNGTARQPVAQPLEQSYTAIAVATAAAATGTSRTHAAPPVRIDYSNALAGIRPDASYAAIAVATAAQNG